MNNFNPNVPPIKNDNAGGEINKIKNSSNETIVSEEDSKLLFVPLTQEDLSISVSDLAKKYNITYHNAFFFKNRGYRSVPNPNFKEFNYPEIDYKKFNFSEDEQDGINGKENPTIKYSKETKELFAKKRVEKILEIFEKNGALILKDPLVLDLQKVKDILLNIDLKKEGAIFFKRKDKELHGEKEEISTRRYLGKLDCFNFLTQVQCFSNDEFDEKKFKNGEIKTHSAFDLPKNKKDLMDGIKENRYLDFMDFSSTQRFLKEKLFLEDGTETNFFEILIAEKMKENNAFRDEQGILKITDPEDGKVKKYSAELMNKIIGKKLSLINSYEDNQKNKKETSSIAGLPFVQSFLKNLYQNGIFQKEDFKVLGNTYANEIFGAHEKKLNPKIPYVSFANNAGSARYYIGRNKIVGTDIKINENMYAIQLDSDLMGIIEKVPNKTTRLLCVFNGLTKEEYNKKKKELDKVFASKNFIPKKEDYTERIYATANEMENKLREYNITEFFPKKEKESPEEYAKRISNLSDFNYVTDKFREFFTETGVGTHKLLWSEQLLLANFMLDQRDDKKIKDFVKNYRINGLRTFLSIEQGGTVMGDKILALGDPDKLPKEVAEKVFKKYGEIIDNVNKIIDFTKNGFTREIETNPELLQKIEENLYLKGKLLLTKIYDDLNDEKEINFQDIENQLDRINADTITTFAIFKQAVKNGEKLPIESIEGAIFSKKDAKLISNEQKDEMLDLYEVNWKNHPDREFVESLKSYFNTAFNPEENKDKNFFYTFEKDNKTRAFVRFEQQGDKSFYASALNVDEASKNFGLGEAMMDEALTREAKEHVLHASCRKDNPSNMRYFEKGFVSSGFKKTQNTEEFDLVWDEEKNKNILAKRKSQEELISMFENKSYEETIEIKKSKNLGELNKEMIPNKTLVRCFIKNGEWYAVYEKIEDDYGVNLSEVK